jgi:multiple sugar transport system permease protein
MVGESGYRRVLNYAFIVLALIVFIFPIYWLVNQSFKNAAEFTAMPPTLLVNQPTGENYRSLWVEQEFWRYGINSFIIAVIASITAVAVGSCAAYGLARFRLRGNFNYHILFTVLTVRMFPPIVTLIPIFAWYNRLELIDHRIPLAILHAFSEVPLVIWMMIGFFREIPRDMEEAALVDGDSRLAVLIKIAIPLARPGLAATFVLVFISSWNEFLFASILTRSQQSMTLPKLVASQIGQFDIKTGNLMAAGVLTTIPVLVLAVAAQRHLTRGLTVGGVTG